VKKSCSKPLVIREGGVQFQTGAALAVATRPGIVPDMETTDQPDGKCDLLGFKTAQSVHGATILCADNAEGAAVVLPVQQEVLLRKETTVRVEREL